MYIYVCVCMCAKCHLVTISVSFIFQVFYVVNNLLFTFPKRYKYLKMF